MKLSLFSSYISLVLLTFLGVGISYWFSTDWAILIVLVMAVTKFLIVAFRFMEMKEAHSLWKFGYTFYALVMGVVLFMLL